MAKFMFEVDDMGNIYPHTKPLYLQHIEDEILQLSDVAIEGFLACPWANKNDNGDVIITLSKSNTHLHFLEHENDIGTYRLERLEQESEDEHE